MATESPLKRSDETRTLPSITMPPKPAFRISKAIQKNLQTSMRIDQEEENLVFPGILKTDKAKIAPLAPARGTSFIGFQPTHLKLDINVTSQKPEIDSYNPQKPQIDPYNRSMTTVKAMSSVDLSAGVEMPIVGTPPKRQAPPPSIQDLRGYIELMDKFSEHNFIIWRGRTLETTPEFGSFMREYNHVWEPIATVIRQIEEFLTYYEINMAIVSGCDIYQLSRSKFPSLSRDQIYTCIANVKEVESTVDHSIELRAQESDHTLQAAVVRAQAAIRRMLSIKHFRDFKRNRISATSIQSLVRRFLQRCKTPMMLNRLAREAEGRWNINKDRLRGWWGELKESYEAADIKNQKGLGSSNPPRTILYVPSITVAEYLRLSYENFQSLQNSHISSLYQLADPDVTIIYVSPSEMSDTEVVYQEKLLAMMGISILPKRLFFVTPEMVHKLPSHLSLSAMLWFSSQALRKIRLLLGKSRCSYMIPTTLGWADKRLSDCFNLPVMGPHPSVAETISSKSLMKRIYLESNVETPIGAHDIYTLEDVLVGLSRLIASNLSINKWFFKLNYDGNNESIVSIDLKHDNVVRTLRKEQHAMIHGTEDYDPWKQNSQDSNQWDSNTWYQKQNQLTVRKTLMLHLGKELSSMVRICRKDIYKSWDVYLKYLMMYGGLIEADPQSTTNFGDKGFLETTCFMDPNGNIESQKSVELYIDNKYQTQGFNFPQMLAPQESVESTMTTICKKLYRKYQVIGYVAVKFLAFVDKNNGSNRLWAIETRLGMGTTFGALGTFGQATIVKDPGHAPTNLPLSLIPEFPEGKFCTFLPMVMHPPLKNSKDETFFHQCKMHGVAFDIQNKVGSIFFLIDSVVSGAISMLFIANTRRRSIEYAIQTLSFITTKFGSDNEAGLRSFDNMTEVLKNMSKCLKYDKHCDSDVQVLIG